MKKRDTIYIDEHGEVVEKEDAIKFEIYEYDNQGNVVRRYYGRFDDADDENNIIKLPAE